MKDGVVIGEKSCRQSGFLGFWSGLFFSRPHPLIFVSPVLFYPGDGASVSDKRNSGSSF